MSLSTAARLALLGKAPCGGGKAVSKVSGRSANFFPAPRSMPSCRPAPTRCPGKRITAGCVSPPDARQSINQTGLISCKPVTARSGGICALSPSGAFVLFGACASRELSASASIVSPGNVAEVIDSPPAAIPPRTRCRSSLPQSGRHYPVHR